MKRKEQLSLAKSQRGASFFATILIVVLIGIFLIAGLKIVPAYMDNGVIVNAMEGIIANNDMNQITVAQVRTQIQRTLNVNGIDNFDSNNIRFVTESGRNYIDINYDTRVDLFYNIDAMVSFENRFER
ncbi:MAG: DUF4845 domain-containing protein [Pseudohongiellaceae bacterium]